MRLQKTKLFTGTALSLLLSLVAVCPAIARPLEEQAQRQVINQTDRMELSQSMRGKIRSIVGNVVTLEMPNGDSTEVMISRTEIQRLGLRPGMEISTSMRDGNLVVEVLNMGSASSASEESTTTEMMGGSTTRRTVVEETTIRRSTSTPARIEQTSEQTSGNVQNSSQMVEQTNESNVEPAVDTTTGTTTQPSRPVRALW
ncbi:hypothetical protein [Aerosakkonema funiforme]|uniref:Uncharacterized protein n=1 Tax=Aerosakkonema funiforme FACHB-1375 TaxID=2949571 RepID=A0A926VEX8_9CYAN|nr:hypothetical protein [Aerosakkonema funiforme]MBD2182554.1 hypothetical protein [Aerosakkonema funiforme FACHB-1375]